MSKNGTRSDPPTDATPLNEGGIGHTVALRQAHAEQIQNLTRWADTARSRRAKCPYSLMSRCPTDGTCCVHRPIDN